MFNKKEWSKQYKKTHKKKLNKYAKTYYLKHKSEIRRRERELYAQDGEKKRLDQRLIS